MNTYRQLALLAGVLGALLALPRMVSATPLVNGGFESGLTGWSVTAAAPDDWGTPGSAGALASHTPADFAPDYVPVEGSLFLDLVPGAVDSYTTVWQTFSMADGDTLSGWAALDSWEAGWVVEPSLADDLAEAVLATPVGDVVVWNADVNSSSYPVEAGPWTSWSYVVPTGGAGDYTLTYRVKNVADGDPLGSSNALFDGTQVTPASTGVPEPGTLVLFGAGLALMVMRRRRSRQ